MLHTGQSDRTWAISHLCMYKISILVVYMFIRSLSHMLIHFHNRPLLSSFTTDSWARSPTLRSQLPHPLDRGLETSLEPPLPPLALEPLALETRTLVLPLQPNSLHDLVGCHTLREQLECATNVHIPGQIDCPPETRAAVQVVCEGCGHVFHSLGSLSKVGKGEIEIQRKIVVVFKRTGAG